ncbi:MAG TPA: aminopeptidase, partial [Clostridia bacterium]|nr:aminopeptidase [Clostridia bacterium]
VSYDRIMDMFFEACALDWDAYAARWRQIAGVLDAGQHLRLVARDTDLSFEYEGERWVVCDNGLNVPDGEIFVSPRWESVEGHIAFDFPATLGGRIIRDLELSFEKGLVTDIRASTNLDFVREVLAQDEGARRCGEFAFGTNPKIDIPTTDILWDEKIAGTVHLALGRPYNKAYASAIHWDIVKDARRDAKAFVDGRLIFQDGEFLDR